MVRQARCSRADCGRPATAAPPTRWRSTTGCWPRNQAKASGTRVKTSKRFIRPSGSSSTAAPSSGVGAVLGSSARNPARPPGSLRPGPRSAPPRCTKGTSYLRPRQQPRALDTSSSGVRRRLDHVRHPADDGSAPVPHLQADEIEGVELVFVQLGKLARADLEQVAAQGLGRLAARDLAEGHDGEVVIAPDGLDRSAAPAPAGAARRRPDARAARRAPSPGRTAPGCPNWARSAPPRAPRGHARPAPPRSTRDEPCAISRRSRPWLACRP